MKEYNNEEKLAIAKILLDLIYIDGKVDRREINYFEKVKEVLELSPEEQFMVTGLNTLHCLGTLKTMDSEQKHAFAEMMRNVILADEYIDPNEAQAFYDVCIFIDATGVGLS